MEVWGLSTQRPRQSTSPRLDEPDEHPASAFPRSFSQHKTQPEPETPAETPEGTKGCSAPFPSSRHSEFPFQPCHASGCYLGQVEQ